MILILSGPIRSYKTTTLMQWAQSRLDCGGVLSPDVDGLRQLYNVKEKTGIVWQKEKTDSSADILVGRFVFDATAFQQALLWLEDQFYDPTLKYIILDEIGPLELNGKGWDSWLMSVLAMSHNKTLILVVREKLVKEVITHYNLVDVKVVGKEYFLL